MGEPLNNYGPVKAAVAAMTDPQLWALARRHVTVSTVGIIPMIRKMCVDMPVRARARARGAAPSLPPSRAR